MSELHESFELLEKPLDLRILEFLQAYCQCKEDGLPIYDRFDFLEWPELVSWMTVVNFPVNVGYRYKQDNAQIKFDGARRVRMFEADLTGQSADILEHKFLDRWSSLYGLCLRHKRPEFARSYVYGIGKEHVKFEIGLFPFAEKDDIISHILSVVQQIYD